MVGTEASTAKSKGRSAKGKERQIIPEPSPSVSRAGSTDPRTGRLDAAGRRTRKEGARKTAAKSTARGNTPSGNQFLRPPPSRALRARSEPLARSRATNSVGLSPQSAASRQSGSSRRSSSRNSPASSYHTAPSRRQSSLPPVGEAVGDVADYSGFDSGFDVDVEYLRNDLGFGDIPGFDSNDGVANYIQNFGEGPSADFALEPTFTNNNYEGLLDDNLRDFGSYSAGAYEGDFDNTFGPNLGGNWAGYAGGGPFSNLGESSTSNITGGLAGNAGGASRDNVRTNNEGATEPNKIPKTRTINVYSTTEEGRKVRLKYWRESAAQARKRIQNIHAEFKKLNCNCEKPMRKPHQPVESPNLYSSQTEKKDAVKRRNRHAQKEKREWDKVVEDFMEAHAKQGCNPNSNLGPNGPRTPSPGAGGSASGPLGGFQANLGGTTTRGKQAQSGSGTASGQNQQGTGEGSTTRRSERLQASQNNAMRAQPTMAPSEMSQAARKALSPSQITPITGTTLETKKNPDPSQAKASSIVPKSTKEVVKATSDRTLRPRAHTGHIDSLSPAPKTKSTLNTQPSTFVASKPGQSLTANKTRASSTTISTAGSTNALPRRTLRSNTATKIPTITKTKPRPTTQVPRSNVPKATAAIGKGAQGRRGVKLRARATNETSGR
ncbi:hypothetical protein CC80DRAFT_558869 [Byssothecium circinans]|uniref:Uncharacterized protein n=1 Tax=Byssothecium circinans TaxID=147558 RepID=A0A6A5TZS2_9PLEO|nr:hypothetical protein CC80DRAFT_558869 [Byssothecium circinans]